jgi:transmembrane sensor
MSADRPSETVRREASEWIARRDAGLSAAEEAELRSWREASPRHAEALARYERLWSTLDRPRAGGVSQSLNRDLALLDQRRNRRRRRVAGAAALGLALLVSAWWGVGDRVRATARTTPSVVFMMPERRVLADGTVVECPPGTRFAVDFSSGKKRQVTLTQGEAHFQVARNPARPFVVVAAGVEVEAVGTAFSVQLGPSVVEVLVTEGRVAIDPSLTSPRGSAAGTGSEATLVVAGHRASVTLGVSEDLLPTSIEAVSTTELDQRLAWRNPRMEFSNTRLRDVVAAINRHAAERGGIRFAIADEALDGVRLSGIFRVDDPRAFIAILETGFGVAAEPAGEQAVLLRRRAAE